MAEDEHDYKVGPGRPPLHTRFRRGQSGNPGGRRKKNLPALLADALEKLTKSRPEGSKPPSGYLSSHPSTQERLRHLRDLAASGGER